MANGSSEPAAMILQNKPDCAVRVKESAGYARAAEPRSILTSAENRIAPETGNCPVFEAGAVVTESSPFRFAVGCGARSRSAARPGFCRTKPIWFQVDGICKLQSPGRPAPPSGGRQAKRTRRLRRHAARARTHLIIGSEPAAAKNWKSLAFWNGRCCDRKCWRAKWSARCSERWLRPGLLFPKSPDTSRDIECPFDGPASESASRKSLINAARFSERHRSTTSRIQAAIYVACLLVSDRGSALYSRPCG